MAFKHNNITRAITEFTSQLRWQSLPPELVDRARICLLDYCGAATVGIVSREAELIRSYIGKIGGQPQSSVFGSRGKSSMPLAALANGVTGHACELDDAHRYATGLHPGTTVIPAVLAVGEHLSASWEDVLCAIICGYEVAGRVGRAINPSHRYRGFHSTGTVGCLGAAAGCARLLGLDPVKTAMAVGIAGSSAGGTFAFLSEGSMNKLLHAGNAAASGVTAALLAGEGFSGPTILLEAKDGFCQAFSDDSNLGLITRDLGKSYEIEHTYFKRHASCGHSFGAIDAALEVRKQIGADRIAEITKIRVNTFKAAAVLDELRPHTIRQAKFSIPFLVSLALHRGQAGFHDIVEESLEDEAILGLARLVEVREDQTINAVFPSKRTAALHVDLADGRSVKQSIDIPRGMPENPLTTEELVEKFKLLTTGIMGPERSEYLARNILSRTPDESIYTLLYG